jgi:hypothetical protein
MKTLDVSVLYKHVEYNPETGIFTRVFSNHPKIKIGDVAGTKSKEGYVSLRIETVVYKAHRLAWLYMTGEMPTKLIDHINGDPSDNRWCNLRQASNKENCNNQKIRSTNNTGYKGVMRTKDGSAFCMQICHNGRYTIEYPFSTAEEAAIRYNELALSYYGDFARLNSIRVNVPSL